MRPLNFILLSLILLACSCHRSGTWNDDSKNWERAFGEHIPTNIVVVHSRFWRSAHWTYEFAYYFEVNGDVRKELLSDTNLVLLSKFEDDFFGEKPAWFAPEQIKDFEVWGYTNSPPSRFRLWVDKSGKRAFFTDYQL